MGKEKGKHRLCGLCSKQCIDVVRLLVEGDKYLALYDGKLVPIIFEDGEQFCKGPKDGYNGCCSCLKKHLSRLDSIPDQFEVSALGDAK
jgi:hypothetical protein